MEGDVNPYWFFARAALRIRLVNNSSERGNCIINFSASGSMVVLQSSIQDRGVIVNGQGCSRRDTE